jgi:hypothetical protein
VSDSPRSGHSHVWPKGCGAYLASYRAYSWTLDGPGLSCRGFGEAAGHLQDGDLVDEGFVVHHGQNTSRCPRRPKHRAASSVTDVSKDFASRPQPLTAPVAEPPMPDPTTPQPTGPRLATRRQASNSDHRAEPTGESRRTRRSIDAAKPGLNAVSGRHLACHAAEFRLMRSR